MVNLRDFNNKSIKDNSIRNDFESPPMSSSGNSSIFDGLIIEHRFQAFTIDDPYNFSYTYLSGNTFGVSWEDTLYSWQESNLTRIMSGGSYFGDGNHTPAWIFTNTTLLDTIPIGVIAQDDHDFIVIDETTHYYLGYGILDIWVLQDVTYPSSIIWYEKSTGILLNGTFETGVLPYTFQFVGTNAEFNPNDHEPELLLPSVSPTEGNQTSFFNFSVIYQDQDDNTPVYVNVLINGTSYTMEKQDQLDDDYIDGCTYQFLTTLQPGLYNYSFQCADNKYSNSTVVFTWVNVTDGGNNNLPNLINGQINPSSGYRYSTIYKFTVDYSDLDNNPPDYINITINSTTYSMDKQDSSDINYMDGCIYTYSTIFNDPGSYYFYFNASDGIYNSSDGIYNGPSVFEHEFQFFDGMYVDYSNNNTYYSDGFANFSYSYESELDFRVTRINPFGYTYWDVNDQTRIMTNFSGVFVYNNNTHSAVRIPTEVSLNDTVLISVLGEGDHSFNVTDEFIYDLPGYGQVEVWVLEDLDGFGGFALYEQSTGILLNGTFIISSGLLNDNLSIIDTNANFYIYSNDYAPSLSMGSVSPSRGNENTEFVFSVNYTDQDNNKPKNMDVIINGTLYEMEKQNPSDKVYTDGCLYEYSTNLTLAPYNYTYYFECFDGEYSNSTIIYNDLEVKIINDFAPNLTNPSVEPLKGDQFTQFNFTILYMDADNNTPSYVYVLINESQYLMVKQNPSDENFIDGCLFQYLTYLSPAASNYTYSFECYDDRFLNFTMNYTNLEVNETNNYAPRLLNPQINPENGMNTTIFEFSVVYYDDDDNLPSFINITINGTGTFSMIKKFPPDNTSTDGIQYYYNTTLDWGFYQFQINCSDGKYVNSTGWIIGPEVNPFYSNVSTEDMTIFEDDFEDGSYVGDWTLTGSGGVGTHTSNSGSYSAYHCYDAGSLTSNIFDLSSYNNVNISFWVRKGDDTFSEDPDMDTEDFFCEFYNTLGVWEQLDYFSALDPVGQIYLRSHTLPANALHSNFRIRFRQEGGSGSPNDYWHFDDVKINVMDSLRINLLSPNNESSFMSGFHNYNWTNFEASFGTVNYTLQISNTTDFTDIIYEQRDIIETPSTTNLTAYIDFSSMIYYWRVRPTFGPFKGNWSDYFIFNLTYNENLPSLISGVVDPISGDQWTQFNFTVNYIDVDNNYPYFINVTINGTSFTMIKQNPFDNDYTDGCIYQYLTTLAPNPYNYSYLFECGDGKYLNSTIFYSDLKVTESNFYTPTLINGQVTPTIGINSTLFNFTVNYFDEDNNLPSQINITFNNTGTYPMLPINPLDTNVTDGILYSFSTTLDFGYYQFEINCSDTNYQNSTGWIIGPEVNPFYGLSVGREIKNVAIFRNTLPWGRNSNEEILTANGISYDVYAQANLGSVSLSGYDKVIIPSVQSQAFYDTLTSSAVRIWLESYVSSGGILELHCAHYSSDIINGAIPGGYNVVYSSDNALTINAIYIDHPIVESITNNEIDGWSSSVHNYLINIKAQDKIIIYDDTNQYPRLITSRFGNGLLIYTGMTVEHGYYYSYSNILENIILYGDSTAGSVHLLKPFNNSLIISGNTNFNWTSFEIPSVTVNYTLQISNTTDFTGIIYEQRDIIEISNTTNLTAYIDFSSMIYYWRVRPTFGPFKGNWSDYFIFNLTYNENLPSLISGVVDPISGDQWTQFNFTVNYIDVDNNYPYFINVTINGTSFTMIKQNPSDINYTNGCIYQYLTTLAPNTYNYSYLFECGDGKYLNSTIFYSDLKVTESNFYTPTLINGQVFPTIGINSTLFNFTVNYFDEDNNLPIQINITINNTGTYPMLAVNPLDTNTTDGIIYYFNTTLDFGYYKFHFNCTDGGFANSTGWIIGPEVNPFYGAGIITLLTPPNTSTFFTGICNFTWTSLDLPHGAVNYTLQISNFSNVLFEKDEIKELGGISNLTQGIYYDSGLYYWRVNASYGMFQSNWSDYFMFNLTYNENNPSLIAGDVDPISGDQWTQFNFTVIYFDADNNYPYFINITINGTSFTMIKQNPSDNDYTDGCVYQYSTPITPNTYNYSYSFECGDGKYLNSTILHSDLQVIESNYYTPTLVNGQVAPTDGDNSTLFNFTITYFDDDNNLPRQINITINNTGTFSMFKALVTDKNVTDGILYYYNTILDWGSYQFQINCYDGAFQNSTGWILGPDINPFIGFNLTSGSGTIKLNEVCLDPDFIEMYNYGSDIVMTGWYMVIYDDNVIDITYNFPAGWTFRCNFIVVLHENTGTDTDTDLYTGGNIYWANRPIAVGLFDNTGACIDWVQTSTHILSRPPDADWTQDTTWTLNNNYAYRTSDIDNDLASDWTVSSSGSQGSLNPGQTGQTGTGGGYNLNLLTPTNGSFLFTGGNNFSWSSIEAPFGPVNYSLQISNTLDFSSIIYEKTNIIEASTITNTSILVNYAVGRYYWRVCPTYGPFKGNWSETFTFDLILNDFAPTLSSEIVNPKNGNQYTQFDFSVIYTDQDNNAPFQMSVFINGTENPMIKQNPLDMDYTDGCIYQYSTQLPIAPYNYNYYFECNDGKYTDTTIIYNDLSVVYMNYNVPRIMDAQVNPTDGSDTTLFSFTAWYFDNDGDLPNYMNININGITFPMVKAVPSDFDATDGIYYYYTTTLDWGSYQFQVECFDGGFTNSTDWIKGPEINPFNYLSGEIERVAIFRNSLPWGYNSNEQILTANGISYDVYAQANLGSVSLSGYDKVIIPSVQSQAFYDILTSSAVRVWLESYISSGGIFEMHAAHQSSDPINGALPGGYTVVYNIVDALTINATFINHPIVENVTNSEIDGWSSSAHSYISNIQSQDQIIIYDETNQYPRLILSQYGSGLLIYTGMTVEWADGHGYSNILENIILYGSENEESIKLVNPSNDTIIEEGGLQTFTWENFDVSFGPVDYTIQISKFADFSTIYHEINNIVETPVITSVSILIEGPEAKDDQGIFVSTVFTNGTYYWRVCPTYGPFKGNWSEVSSFFVSISPNKEDLEALQRFVSGLILIIILGAIAGAIGLASYYVYKHNKQIFAYLKSKKKEKIDSFDEIDYFKTEYPETDYLTAPNIGYTYPISDNVEADYLTAPNIGYTYPIPDNVRHSHPIPDNVEEYQKKRDSRKDIGIRCSNCQTSRSLQQNELKDYYCWTCGQLSFEVIYYCLLCSRIFIIPGSSIKSLMEHNQLYCTECNVELILDNPDDYYNKVFNLNFIESTFESKTIDISTRSRQASTSEPEEQRCIICTNCSRRDLIFKDELKKFRCDRCGKDTINIIYHCLDCDRQHGISKEEYIRFLEPRMMQCPICESKTILVDGEVYYELKIGQKRPQKQIEKHESKQLELVEIPKAVKKERIEKIQVKKIVVACSKCTTPYYIIKDNLDIFQCDKCTNETFRVIYQCKKCKAVSQIRKEIYLESGQQESFDCSHCEDRMVLLFKTKEYELNTENIEFQTEIKMSKREATNLKADETEKSKPPITYKPVPVKIKKDIKVEVMCSKCTAKSFIINDKLDKFKCNKCLNEKFKVKYQCNYCKRIEFLSKETYLASEQPDSFDCYYCRGRMNSFEIEKSRPPITSRARPVKSEKDIQIGVMCSNCQEKSYIQNYEKENYQCEKCSNTSFFVGYYCEKCDDVNAISKQAFINMNEQIIIDCSKCGNKMELLYKSNYQDETRLQDKEAPAPTTSRIRKSKPLIRPRVLPVKPIKDFRIGVMCSNCQDKSYIQNSEKEKYKCEKCSNSTFFIGYYCKKCEEIYAISKQAFINNDEQLTIDCSKCGKKMKIIKK